MGDARCIPRMTQQRQVILEVLRPLTSHPTADELYVRVRRRLPRISLGTIYRNLDILAQCGLIQKLEGGTQRRYDGNVEPHYHIRCVRCGRVDDVPMAPVDDLDRAATKACPYEVTGHDIEFRGVCPHCRDGKRRARPQRTTRTKHH